MVFITGFLTVSLLFISAILMLAREPILSGVSWGLTSRLFPRREEKLVELLPSKSKLIELTPTQHTMESGFFVSGKLSVLSDFRLN